MADVNGNCIKSCFYYDQRMGGCAYLPTTKFEESELINPRDPCLHQNVSSIPPIKPEGIIRKRESRLISQGGSQYNNFKKPSLIRRIIDFFKTPPEMYATDEESDYIEEHFNNIPIFKQHKRKQ